MMFRPRIGDSMFPTVSAASVYFDGLAGSLLLSGSSSTVASLSSPPISRTLYKLGFILPVDDNVLDLISFCFCRVKSC